MRCQRCCEHRLAHHTPTADTQRRMRDPAREGRAGAINLRRAPQMRGAALERAALQQQPRRPRGRTAMTDASTHLQTRTTQAHAAACANWSAHSTSVSTTALVYSRHHSRSRRRRQICPVSKQKHPVSQRTDACSSRSHNTTDGHMPPPPLPPLAATQNGCSRPQRTMVGRTRPLNLRRQQQQRK